MAQLKYRFFQTITMYSKKCFHGNDVIFTELRNTKNYYAKLKR